MEISQIVKEKRVEQKLTQEQLGNVLLVSKKTIFNWESGRTTPDITSLVRMAQLFNFSLDKLLVEDNVLVEDMRKKEKLAQLTKIYWLGPITTEFVLLVLLILPPDILGYWTLELLMVPMLTNAIVILYFKMKLYKLKGEEDNWEKEWRWSRYIVTLLVLFFCLFLGFLFYL